MTDRLTPADVLELIFKWRHAIPPILGAEIARLRADEAARREAEAENPEVRELVREWKPDAPPPPAPDDRLLTDALRAELIDTGGKMVRQARRAEAAEEREAKERARAEAAEALAEKRADEQEKLILELCETRDARDEARADAKRLRDLNQMAQRVLARAFDRIHGLPRTSDTKLANDISVARAALAQGGNDG